MIIKRKKVVRKGDHGFEENQSTVKNAPGFHSVSTSYESYKQFSDDEIDYNKKDLATLGGAALGIGAGIGVGKFTRDALNGKAKKKAGEEFSELNKKYKTDELKRISDKYKSGLKELQEKRNNRQSPGLIGDIVDLVDGGKDKKKALEDLDNQIAGKRNSARSEISSLLERTKDSRAAKREERKKISEELASKLKKNKLIGKGAGILGAGALAYAGAKGVSALYNPKKKKMQPVEYGNDTYEDEPDAYDEPEDNNYNDNTPQRSTTQDDDYYDRGYEDEEDIRIPAPKKSSSLLDDIKSEAKNFRRLGGLDSISGFKHSLFAN